MGLSATYVLPAAGKTASGLKPIASYYTLSLGQIYRTSLPNTKKLPHYPVPVIVLARLAVDRQIQGQDYGDITLIKAIRHSAMISNTIPAYSLMLNVKDAEAMRFYQRYPDFKPLTNNPSRLFLPATDKQFFVLFCDVLIRLWGIEFLFLCRFLPHVT